VDTDVEIAFDDAERLELALFAQTVLNDAFPFYLMYKRDATFQDIYDKQVHIWVLIAIDHILIYLGSRYVALL
jgi:hypothetical protein